MYKLSWRGCGLTACADSVNPHSLVSGSVGPAIQIRHPRTRRWWMIRLLLLSRSSADGRLAGACRCYLWPGSGSVSDLSEASWWQLAFGSGPSLLPKIILIITHFPFHPAEKWKNTAGISGCCEERSVGLHSGIRIGQSSCFLWAYFLIY